MHLRPAVPEGDGQAQHPRRQRGAAVQSRPQAGEEDSVALRVPGAARHARCLLPGPRSSSKATGPVRGASSLRYARPGHESKLPWPLIATASPRSSSACGRCGGRGRGRRAFPEGHRGLRARRGGDPAGLADGETRRVAVHGGAILSSACDGAASSPAATTARSWRPMPRARATTVATDAKRRWIDHVAAAPAARSPGRPASRPSSAPARARRNRSRSPRPSARSRSRRKVSGSRSRTTTAPRSGFRMPRPSPSRWNGRARTSARSSVRTAASW